MRAINESGVDRFVETIIQDFHSKILQRLMALKLNTILKRKNPYLFRAKSITTASDLVKSILDAHLSSQEEAIFGTFLEQLAIFLCKRIYDGKKSSSEGIDLDFEANSIRYLVSIKSGPNWGNSSQIAKMREQFKKAKRILGTNVSTMNVVAVNGCCYGRDDSPDKGDYLKLCGQRFWELISGDPSLYIDMIQPIGRRAKRHTDQFQDEYAKIINRFTLEFSSRYCDSSGAIVWKRLVKFNSGREKYVP